MESNQQARLFKSTLRTRLAKQVPRILTIFLSLSLSLFQSQFHTFWIHQSQCIGHPKCVKLFGPIPAIAPSLSLCLNYATLPRSERIIWIMIIIITNLHQARTSFLSQHDKKSETSQPEMRWNQHECSQQTNVANSAVHSTKQTN